MMEYARAGDPAQFCVIARPQALAGSPGLRLAMFILLPGSGLIGAFFLSQGLWPVAVVLSLPVSGLLWSVHHLQHHADDFERLTLADKRLILERHTADQDQRQEFNSDWVQVALQPGRGRLLCFHIHDREVAFGYFLSEEERAALKRELNQRLAHLKQH